MKSEKQAQKFHADDASQNPDLDDASDWLKQVSYAARPIRSPTQIWVVTSYQYWISALDSQTLFRGENSGGVAKCGIFSGYHGTR